MLKLVSFFVLLGWAVYPSAAQPTPPAVPDQDYAVYAATLDRFLGSRRELNDEPKSRPLLFMSETTEVLGRYGFDVDFKDLGSRSLSPFPRPDSPINTPEWTSFITSVDTSQFKQYRLERLPNVTGHKMQFWSRKLSERYFAKNSPHQGYYGLRKDYKNFESITSFSKAAYSSDGQKALCYFSEASDGLAGAGYLVFLERRGGRWQVVDSLMLWIS